MAIIGEEGRLPGFSVQGTSNTEVERARGRERESEMEKERGREGERAGHSWALVRCLS